MDVTASEGPAAFLRETVAYRTDEPLRTNLLGSVASTAAEAASWWATRCWVVRDGGSVVGAALRTAPLPVVLGPMPNSAAAAAAAAVAETDDDLPGVTGYGTAVEAFLDGYRRTGTPGSRRAVTGTERQLLYATSRVVVPVVPGVMTVASVDRLALAERWYGEFVAELDGGHHVVGEGERAATRTAVEGGRVRWWEHDGEVVSMAGHAEPVATPAGTVTRVGPVYTPPPYRRRGYAAAVTGGLTEQLLARGSRVMLFADRANPTSNGVYVRLGYEPLDESVRVTLAAA